MAQLRRARVLLVAALGLLSTVAAVRADWLVRKDGQRIETQGPVVTQDGMVAYYDRAGAIRVFPLIELDANKTKLANFVAQKQQTAEQRVVVDESQVVSGDEEVSATLQEYEEAPTPGAQEAALRKMNATLDRLGGTEVRYRRCGERYPDWMDQAMCRLGVSSMKQSWSAGDLRSAVRSFQCRRRYPRNAAGFQACRQGKG